MTTTDAISNIFGTLYPVLRLQLSPPELLKMAALQCFMYPHEYSLKVIYKIKNALLFLNENGLFQE